MGSELDWGTVVRSDEPLSATAEEEILHVPELTDELLDTLDAEALESTQETPQEQTGEPGSQVECDVCGRTVRVRKDGKLSVHKCEPKAERGRRLDTIPSPRPKTPRRAREFTIGVLAWAVEEGSAHALARPLGADPADVPSDLPDAEGMIGPPLDLVWPSIPDSAKKFIEACADNSDLIACALAWGDWLRILGKWTRDQRAYNQRLSQEATAHGSVEFAGADVIPGRFAPFTPA